MNTSLLAVLGRGVVDPDSPLVHADDAGLTRGDGCFEGCRLRRHGRGVRLDDFDAHLARMARSAAALDLSFDPAAWEELAGQLGGVWARHFPGEVEAVVRLVLTRGRPGLDVPTGFATAAPMPAGTIEARRDGIDVVVLTRGTMADSFAASPWLLGGVKTLSYAINMAAQREAERRGAHDALFVTAGGELLEAPTSSVVWVSGSTLTMVADGPNGILHSITTEVLLDRAADAGFAVVTGAGTVNDLRAAEIVMLVSSVRGPVRVRTLDGVALAATPAGAETLATCQRLTEFDH